MYAIGPCFVEDAQVPFFVVIPNPKMTDFGANNEYFHENSSLCRLQKVSHSVHRANISLNTNGRTS